MKISRKYSTLFIGAMIAGVSQGAVIETPVVEGVSTTNEIVMPDGFSTVIRAVNVNGSVDDTINGITFAADTSGGTGYTATDCSTESSSALSDAVFSTTTVNLSSDGYVIGDSISGLSPDTDYAMELFFSDNNGNRYSDAYFYIGGETNSIGFNQGNGSLNRVRVEFNTGDDTAFGWSVMNDASGGHHVKFSGYAFYSASSEFLSAVASASPISGAVPLEVVFDGSGSSSSSDIVSYSWDFGDSSAAVGEVVTNTYTAVGEYTAKLVVVDANGLTATNTVDIDVYDYIDAESTASATEGDIPMDVIFEATNSSSSSTITSYAWTFGDGNTASGAVVTNTYDISGCYTATLIVEDSNGLTDTNSFDITAYKTVSSDYVQYSETYTSNNTPSFSTSDLAQTEYLSSEGTGDNESGEHAQLFNGLVGNLDGDTNDDGEVRLTSAETITVTFDTSVNTNGYDIDMIETIAGWTPTTYTATQTSNQSRSNQGYEIIARFADGSIGSFAGPEHWEPNGESVWTNSVGTEVNDKYWTKVSFTNAVGSDAMLRNVVSLTFDISNDAMGGGVVIYREIDVFGTASTAMVPNDIVIEYDSDGNSLSWASDSSYSYSVQSNLNLSSDTWGTFTNITGTPPETTVSLPAQTEDQMFIRVIVE